MKIAYLIFWLPTVVTGLASGQVNVNLSKKHFYQINKLTAPSQKLALYRKYFTKDSIRAIKKAEDFWQAKTDSLAEAIAQREEALERKGKLIKDGVNSRIFRTVYKPWARKLAAKQLEWLHQHNMSPSPILHQILFRYFEEYFLAATQNDSTLTVLRTQMPSLHMPRQLMSKVRDYRLIKHDQAKNIEGIVKGKIKRLKNLGQINAVHAKAQGYLNESMKYSRYADLLNNSDSLKGLAYAQGEKIGMNYLSKIEGHSSVRELVKYQDEIEKVKEMPGQYKSRIEQLSDSAYVKDQAKKKAEEMAMKYITEHPGIMQGVRKKMSLLMRKYSVVYNSNDLSTAIKRTSLKGKPVRERLYFASNFQLLSLTPLNIDFSPMAGYRFNKKFVTGLGFNYRQSFRDSLPTLSRDVLGYKIFSSFDVVKSFFAYGEFDRNVLGIHNPEGPLRPQWKNAAFLGIGRKIRVHPRFEMTMMFLYNFLREYPDPIYPNRWNVRIGIQTSALGMFKLKPTFK
jgi:hypothetical protein